MADSPLMKRMRDRAKNLGARAVSEFLNEDRSEVLGNALKGVQQGRRLIDESSTKLLATLGVASTADLERVSQKVGRIKKRMQRLLDALETSQS